MSLRPRRLALFVAPSLVTAAVLASALSSCITRDVMGPDLYCDTNNPCEDPMYPVCDPGSHKCVAGDAGITAACGSNKSCPDEQPICNTQAGLCGPCTGDGPSAACGAQHQATPICDGSTGRCVVCRGSMKQSTDCTDATRPVCDGACRSCRSGKECDSGVCLHDGRCAASDQLVYVDNVACKGQAPTGSRAAPWCEIADAVAQPKSGANVVLVAGSAAVYTQAVTISSGDFTFVGPGRIATVGAHLASVAAQAPCLSVTSGAKSVTVDGLSLDLCGSHGVSCSGGVPLTIVRSAIVSSTETGVFGGDCVVTLDGDEIKHAGRGGVRIAAGGKYDIRNTVIHDGSGGPGVYLDAASSGVFAFNTVVSNLAGSTAGGVVCGTGAMKPILFSIFWKNDIGVDGSQFGGACAVIQVVAGTEETSKSTINVDPMLDVSSTPTPYHLTAASKACIDKVVTTDGAQQGIALPLLDAEGKPRPAGAAWDIGADEWQGK